MFLNYWGHMPGLPPESKSKLRSTVDYFKDRGHSTNAADVSSLIAWMHASIIQGSVVGPPSYVVAASDLHPKHKKNDMTKFADDTYLLVCPRSVGTVTDEFVNIRN